MWAATVSCASRAVRDASRLAGRWGRGFVASLAHPGGNITGLSDLSTELPAKRLELLKETVPQSARVAVLANPTIPYYGTWMHTLTVAARALHLHLHIVELRRIEEVDTAFAACPTRVWTRSSCWGRQR